MLTHSILISSVPWHTALPFWLQVESQGFEFYALLLFIYLFSKKQTKNTKNLEEWI